MTLITRLFLLGAYTFILSACGGGGGGPTISGTGGCPQTPLFLLGQVSSYDVQTSSEPPTTVTFTVSSIGPLGTDIDVQYGLDATNNPVTITYTECELSLSRELEWYEQLVLFTFETLYPLPAGGSDNGNDTTVIPQDDRMNSTCTEIEYTENGLNIPAVRCTREQFSDNVATNDTRVTAYLQGHDYIIGEDLLFYERLDDGALTYRVTYVPNDG